MSTEHYIIVESGTWPHPITHPMQIGFLSRKYIHCDAAYTPPPHLGSIEQLQHNFEDRLRRAGAEFNPRQQERKPHTYHVRVPAERLGEVVTLLHGHPAAQIVIHIAPSDGAEEALKGTLWLESAPQAPAKRIIARFRLQNGTPAPCAEGDEAGPGDSLALLMADHREHRYGGQEYLAELAGRPLEPGKEAVLIIHNGSVLPWAEGFKRRYEDDVEVYTTLRGSKTMFHAIWPARLRRLPHSITSWEREPMDALPAGLLETIQHRPELMRRMRYHCERVAMSRQPLPGCTHTEGVHIRQLSLCDLLRLWQNGEHPWVARTYHDGLFLTYRIAPNGTAYGWSLKHQCPVKFQLEH